MANAKKSGTLGTQMTRGELIGGFLFLPLYLLIIPYIVSWILSALGLDVSLTTLNFWIFLVNLLIIVVIFRRFLVGSLLSIRRHFWDFLQAVVLAFVFYYALNWVLYQVLNALGLWLDSTANNSSVLTLIQSNFPLMLVCTVVLAPVVEEVLVRGLFFGNIHVKSRILAYLSSVVLFCTLHVWQFVGDIGWNATLLSALQYIPAGIALGWAYEKSRTIWAPILVHCLINALALGLG